MAGMPGPGQPRNPAWTAADGNIISPTARRLMLTDAGREYVEASFARDGPLEVGTWEIYFDTRQLTLARRGARLRERSGAWELQVLGRVESSSLLEGEPPLAVPAPRGPASPDEFETMTDAAEILARLGISTPTMEVQDAAGMLRKLLAKHGVKPIARLRADRCTYCVERCHDTGCTRCCTCSSEAHSAPGGTSLIVISLEHVHFDPAHAEPGAVSEFLSDCGFEPDGTRAPPREALQMTFAELRVAHSGNWCAGDLRAGRAWVAEFLRRHGLDTRGGGSVPGTSVMAAYLCTCRPEHWRALRKAGILLEPEPPPARPVSGRTGELSLER